MRQYQVSHCANCNCERRFSRKSVNHRTHLHLTFATLGLWGVVWMFLVLRLAGMPRHRGWCGIRMQSVNRLKEFSGFALHSSRILLVAASAGCLYGGCTKSFAPSKALPATVGIRSEAFRQGMGAVVEPGFVAGNDVRILENGDEIFPAMLRAIRGARKTINFETFVFERGDVPQAFAQALAERARAGVRVNVVLDAVGAAKSRTYQKGLREAGVQIEPFHSIMWLDPRRYNYRTHRKILVIDGKIGFTGGVGIADEWRGNASSPDQWRDLHFRVEGPVVAQLQGVFAANWFHTHKEILQGPDYFPPLSSAGSLPARFFQSSPRQMRAAVELSYQLAIASAQKSLLIESPYFVPDRALVEALCEAAGRHVRIQILMPGDHIDQKAVRRASRKRWPKLLAAGVELFEYQPTMIHTKLMIADGYFVGVGSANFDPRSLSINDEANLNVLDSNLAGKLTRVFEGDLRKAQRVEGGKPRLDKVHEVPVQAAQTPLESQL